MKWKKEEVDLLKESYPKRVTLKEISNKLGKSIKSVKHKAARIGIHRPRFRPDKINQKEPRWVIDKRYYENNKEKVYLRKMNRRKRLKEEVVNMLGNKCRLCGYNKSYAAFDFHHDKGEKEENISYLIKNESRQKLLKEVEKCILLCSNCHRELHNKGP
ncbi:MAG: hypothetical protein AABW51_01350 [Nanoarchaeota archaeon]